MVGFNQERLHGVTIEERARERVGRMVVKEMEAKKRSSSDVDDEGNMLETSKD